MSTADSRVHPVAVAAGGDRESRVQITPVEKRFYVSVGLFLPATVVGVVSGLFIQDERVADKENRDDQAE